MSDLLIHEHDRSEADRSRPSVAAVADDDTGTLVRTATHWPALDGLRGIAVAGVVAYHLGWISGGFLGVDLFFALSGFLITSLLVREHRDTGGIDLVAFWARRFRRLLPAVMVLIVGVLAFCAIWGTPAEQAGARGDARWSIAYLANWHFIAAARDYWAPATDSSVFTHLWSLAIEEQFYVVWPVVAWWALRSRGGERRLVQIVVIGTVASVAALMVLHDPADPSRGYLGTDTRAAALLLGALMALRPVRRLLRAGATWRPVRLDVLVALLAALMGVWWVVGGDHLDLLLQGGLPVHSSMAAVLVAALATSSGVQGRSARVLDRGWLVWLGQRSYGVYLWHWPVIVLAEPRWDALPAPVRDVTMIVLSLALAEVSFRLVEHPIRRRVGWATGGRATWATVTVCAMAVGAALVAPSGRGHVAAFDVGSVGSAAPASPAAPVTTEAAPVTPVTPVTPAPSPPSSPAPAPSTAATAPADAVAPLPAATGVAAGATAAAAVRPPLPVMREALWVGDSVARDLAPALQAAFGAAGVAWTDGAGDGVHFTPSDDVDPTELWSQVLAGATFDTVVLQLSYWDSPADLEVLRTSLGWFRDQVAARGARLVIVTPPPVRDDLVDPGLARQLQVAQEMVDTGNGGVLLIDSAPAWGSTMAFDIDGDGAPDRKPDGVHVCPQGAARFAAWLVDAMAERFDGVAPQPVTAWAGGTWAADVRYDTPAGACVSLT